MLKLNTAMCSSKCEVNCELVLMKVNTDIVVPTYYTLNCHLLCFISCLYSKPIALRNDRMMSVRDFELSWSPVLNTVVSGYHDWFQQIRKRLHG